MITLTCFICKKTLDIPGHFFSRDVYVSTTWRCEECQIAVDKIQEDRVKKQWGEVMTRYQERKSKGEQIVLIPAGTLPPGTSEEIVIKAMMEKFCIKWTRLEDGSVVLWGEM